MSKQRFLGPGNGTIGIELSLALEKQLTIEYNRGRCDGLAFAKRLLDCLTQPTNRNWKRQFVKRIEAAIEEAERLQDCSARQEARIGYQRQEIPPTSIDGMEGRTSLEQWLASRQHRSMK